jgi:four helix bundle protein
VFGCLGGLDSWCGLGYYDAVRDLAKSEVLSGARALIKTVYLTSKSLPASERFELSSQMRRAVVSVAANIAEGLGRGTEGDLERHLRIASGSAAELEILLDAATDLGMLTQDSAEVRREIRVLRAKLYRLTVRVAAAR